MKSGKLDKKKVYISVVIILVLFFVGLMTVIKIRNNIVYIVEDKSFLSDFSIEEDQVRYHCFITIRNKTNRPIGISFTASSNEDYQSGLIREPKLYVHCDEANTKHIIPERTETGFYVDFYGCHGTNTQKSNRLLPQIELSYVYLE